MDTMESFDRDCSYHHFRGGRRVNSADPQCDDDEGASDILRCSGYETYAAL